jgi:hypothetical protein
VTERPPFTYERRPRPEPTLAMVDVVIAAADDAVRSRAERLAASLREAGVADDALRVIEPGDVPSLNQGIQQGARPFVCVLDAAIQPDGTERIGTLLRLMHEHDADLAAPKLIGEDGAIVWANPGFEDGSRPARHGPGARDAGQYDRVTDAPWVGEKLMMTRREVVNAVGGLDEGYEDMRTAFVDFSLRARQRRFKCLYVGTVAFRCAAADPVQDDAALDRLRRKWAEYSHLFRVGSASSVEEVA